VSDGLIARMEAASERAEHVVVLDGAHPEPTSWAALHHEARRLAAALQAKGVVPGDRVALLGASSRALVATLEGCWLAGAAVVLPPLRTRLESEAEFGARTTERIALAEAALTVCDPELAPVATAPSLPSPVTFSELASAAARLRPADYERPADDPERTAVLQFTSGSTADPKGVVIPERCLLDNLDAVVDRAPLEVPGDVIVSWLPLYHDMGLVYNTALALVTGVQFVLAPPARFVTSPGSWMEWMSAFGGTWTIGPNFALALAARLMGQAASSLDLARCRRLGNGSEPVAPDVMERLAAAGAGHGLSPGALYAGYGMAEATVAVSFVAPGEGFEVDVVDARSLEVEGVAERRRAGDPSARRLARCGPPLRGMEVRVTDPDTGSAVGDRVVGEIELRGPSVVPGYFRRPDATAAAFRPDGWLRSGDLGYVAEGELVIAGRIKDVIIVGGRNVLPEDLERPAQEVEGVRAGNVIAFGVDRGRKGEALVVVAELKDGDPAAVRDGIARTVRSSVGLRLDDVVLVAPGRLPKTSSGKLRRSACRSQYEAGELERL
jgi:fatty-acyl-CoA synthase